MSGEPMVFAAHPRRPRSRQRGRRAQRRAQGQPDVDDKHDSCHHQPPQRSQHMRLWPAATPGPCCLSYDGFGELGISGLCASVRGEWERASGLTPWCVWTALSFRLYGSACSVRLFVLDIHTQHTYCPVLPPLPIWFRLSGYSKTK